MVLTDLSNTFQGQPIFILGTGPTLSLFPENYFKGKTCILLNNAYKIVKSDGPIGLFHSIDYLYDTESFGKLMPYAGCQVIDYPIVKLNKNTFDVVSDAKFPFYFYYYSHEIDAFDANIISNKIYYSKDGSSLHAALQVANIMGASEIYICGCDARTFSGNHYGSYPDDGFRAKENVARDYDAYTAGAVSIIKSLYRKGTPVNYLSPLIGYNSLEYQFDQFSALADKNHY